MGTSLLRPLPEASAQDIEVPMSIQVALLSKILSFDRNLERQDGAIVVGVVYQRRVRASVLAKESVISLVGRETRATGGVPIRCLPIDLTDVASLDSAIVENDIDVLYITPLRAVNLQSITAISRKRGVLTSTGVTEYVPKGVAVGFGAEQERPRILVNLPAAKAEGADLSSGLLKLVQLIESEQP